MIGLQYKKDRTKKARGKGIKHERDIKLLVVNEVIECGNVSATARKHDLASQTVDNWMKKLANNTL